MARRKSSKTTKTEQPVETDAAEQTTAVAEPPEQAEGAPQTTSTAKTILADVQRVVADEHAKRFPQPHVEPQPADDSEPEPRKVPESETEPEGSEEPEQQAQPITPELIQRAAIFGITPDEAQKYESAEDLEADLLRLQYLYGRTLANKQTEQPAAQAAAPGTAQQQPIASTIPSGQANAAAQTPFPVQPGFAVPGATPSGAPAPPTPAAAPAIPSPAPPAQPPAIPQFEPVDLGSPDDGLHDEVVHKINKNTQALAGALQGIYAQQQQLAQALAGAVQVMQAQRALEEQREFEEHALALGDEYADLLGKVPPRRLPPDSPQRQNWKKLQDTVTVLSKSYASLNASGARLPVPPPDELIRQAARLAFADSVETAARRSLVAKLKKQAGSVGLPPSHRRAHAQAESKEEAAITKVAEILQRAKRRGA